MARSIMDRVINYYIIESLKRINNDDVYITELVNCPMKYYLRLRYPSLMVQYNFNEKILIGKLLHEGIESIIRRIISLANNNIEIEKPISLEIDGLRVIGRADIVTDSEVIEIKTTRSCNGLPHDNHMLQASIYAYALNKPSARLVYIVLNNDVRILEYYVDPITREDLEKLVMEFREAKPSPRYTWECNYCIFKAYCPNRVVNNQ